MVVELLARIEKKTGRWESKYLSVLCDIRVSSGVADVPIAARATKPTAETQTLRKAVEYVSNKAPAPAPII